MVVSEMGEQWSPQTAPAMQAEMQTIAMGLSMENTFCTMGIRMPKVPQEVPVAKASRQPMANTIRGTSWGTFGILIPIVQNVFSMDDPLAIICISACMAGAVCGDHCSPISDTTIMASAGAQCDHVNHVSTQLPYAICCAAISAVSYLIAGILASAGLPGIIALPIGIALMVGFLFLAKGRTGGAAKA